MSIIDNKYNISVWQGSTFGMAITVKTSDDKPQDLTGYSARMQVRPTYKSNTVIETLATSATSTSSGEIIIDATEGLMTLELSATRTAQIPVDLSSASKPPKSTYVYDLEIQDSAGVVSKVLWGDFIVYGEVTR